MRPEVNQAEYGPPDERTEMVELGQVIVQLTRIWTGQEPDPHDTVDQNMADGDNDSDDSAADTAAVKDSHVQELVAKLSETEARSSKFETAFKEQQQELRKLHSILLAQNRQREDPFDDRAIRTKVGELEAAIGRLVRRHFRDPRNTTGWREYDEVIAADDKEFFLQAEIASYVADSYFGGNAPRRFGFGMDVDKALAKIEAMMKSSGATKAKAVDWRVETIDTARLLGSRKTIISTALKDKIIARYQAIIPEERIDIAALQEAISKLCRLASELALAIRSCRPTYVWEQSLNPSSFREEDVQWIEPYNVRPGSPPRHIPVKVVFGPVYKIVDGEKVLLREGRVLRS